MQVKALYIKNLPRDITQERLKALFEHHGKILKVVIPPAKPGKEDSRYGFVHYAERTSVMKALKNTERYEIDGTFIIYLFFLPLLVYSLFRPLMCMLVLLILQVTRWIVLLQSLKQIKRRIQQHHRTCRTHYCSQTILLFLVMAWLPVPSVLLVDLALLLTHK